MSDLQNRKLAVQKTVDALGSKGAYEALNLVRGTLSKISAAITKETETRLLMSLAVEVEDDVAKEVLAVLGTYSIADAVEHIQSASNLINARLIEQANKSNVGSFGIVYDPKEPEASEPQEESPKTE